MINIFQIVMLLAFTAVALRFLRKSSSAFDVSLTLGSYVLTVAFLLRPTMLIEISQLVGIGRGVDLFLYLAIFVLFGLFFKLLMAIDRNRQDVSRLNRKLTILLKEKLDDEGRSAFVNDQRSVGVRPGVVESGGIAIQRDRTAG